MGFYMELLLHSSGAASPILAIAPSIVLDFFWFAATFNWSRKTIGNKSILLESTQVLLSFVRCLIFWPWQVFFCSVLRLLGLFETLALVCTCWGCIERRVRAHDQDFAIFICETVHLGLTVCSTVFVFKPSLFTIQYQASLELYGVLVVPFRVRE